MKYIQYVYFAPLSYHSFLNIVLPVYLTQYFSCNVYLLIIMLSDKSNEIQKLYFSKKHLD